MSLAATLYETDFYAWIQDQAAAFSREWADAGYEKGETQELL